MTFSSKHIFKISFMAASVAMASSVYSAGFSLNDQSATASGNALAGAAASGENISFSFWNPALLLNAKQTSLYLSGAYVVPSMDASVTLAQDADSAGGNDLTASSATRSSDSVDDAFIPSIYFAKPLSDKTVAGVSLNVPFGLSGDYGDDWAGRFHATETSIEDIALSFSLAHQVTDKLSVGASAQLHQAEVVLASAVGSTNATYGGEGDGYIEADATGYGFSLGALFEPVKGTRIGLGYRSEVEFDFEGDVTYSDISSVLAASLVDASVSDSLVFPSVLTISLDQTLTKKLRLGLTAMQTGWGSIDELRVDFDSDQPDSVLTLNFEDQWLYSVGLTYEYSEKLVLRTGLAIDSSPVTDEYRSARTPDGDRKWVSLGGTYDFNNMTSATFAYTYVMIDDVSVSRDGSLTEDDAARGTFDADYESSAHVLSVALNMSF